MIRRSFVADSFFFLRRLDFDFRLREERAREDDDELEEEELEESSEELELGSSGGPEGDRPGKNLEERRVSLNTGGTLDSVAGASVPRLDGAADGNGPGDGSGEYGTESVGRIALRLSEKPSIELTMLCS